MKRKLDDVKIIADEIIMEHPLINLLNKKGYKTGTSIGRDNNIAKVGYVCNYDDSPNEKSLEKDIPGLCLIEVSIPDDSDEYKININPFNDPLLILMKIKNHLVKT